MAENKKWCAYVSSNEIQQPKKYKIDMIEKNMRCMEDTT